MENLSSFTEKYLERFKNKKGVGKHWKWSYASDIIDIVGETKQYNFFYWLRKLKEFEQRGGDEGRVGSYLYAISNLPNQFNKGAILTNKLKYYGQEKKDQSKTKK